MRARWQQLPAPVRVRQACSNCRAVQLDKCDTAARLRRPRTHPARLRRHITLGAAVAALLHRTTSPVLQQHTRTVQPRDTAQPVRSITVRLARALRARPLRRTRAHQAARSIRQQLQRTRQPAVRILRIPPRQLRRTLCTVLRLAATIAAVGTAHRLRITQRALAQVDTRITRAAAARTVSRAALRTVTTAVLVAHTTSTAALQGITKAAVQRQLEPIARLRRTKWRRNAVATQAMLRAARQRLRAIARRLVLAPFRWR